MSATPITADSPRWSRWVFKSMAQALARLVRPARAGAAPVWRAFARIAVGTAVGMGVLILTMVFADVPGINAARQLPQWLVGIFQFVTRLGLSGWFLVPLGVALLAVALIASPSLTRVSRLALAVISVRLGFLFLAIAVPGLVVTIAKRLIGRARPLVGGEPDAFLYKFFLWRPDYASLPSGHATTAFAAAVAFGVLWPRLRPLMWTYAVLIALSRVIVTAHHPSDVLAGAFAGGIGALLVRDWMATRRLGFVIRADGMVEPMPGPSLARLKRVARELAGP